MHFGHIKTFLYVIGTSGELDDEEVTWLASHLDLGVGQIGDRALWKTVSPDTKLCSGRPLEYNWAPGENDRIRQWGLAAGRDYERAFLHYREDTLVPLWNSVTPGWNPDDDQGQCGGVADDWVNDLIANVDGSCSGLPSDPNRTAATGVDARLHPSLDRPEWNMPDVLSDEWRDWAVHEELDNHGWGPFVPDQLDCVWEDNAMYHPWGVNAIEKTFRYWDITVVDGDGNRNLEHPLIEDRPRGGAEFIDALNAAVAGQVDEPVFGWPNVGAAWPHTIPPHEEIFLHYFDHVYVEWWLWGTDGEESGPSYAVDYENSVRTILEFTRDQGENRYLQVNAHRSTATDEWKILALASFYLVNNDHTFFSFLVQPSADYPERGTDHPSNFMWFDAIEFDVGAPRVNRLGLPDYLGNPGSSEHYEFAAGDDPGNPGETFHVMARDYDRALVLVKFRQERDSIADDSTTTTHGLDGTYRPLRADGTLGPELTSITLRNSQGAILVRP